MRLPHSPVSISLLQPEILNNPLGIHLPTSLGLNSAQWGECFAPSRGENLHFFMGLSKATRTLGRIHYLNMQIGLSMQIDWICSCLLGVNTGSNGDIFSQVTCGFPLPSHKDSKCTPPCLVDLLGWPKHTKEMEPKMGHGLQAWS